MNWKIHIITFAVFLLVIGTVKLVWENPHIVLYIILSGIGLLAYGALYMIVKAKLENNKKGDS